MTGDSLQSDYLTGLPNRRGLYTYYASMDDGAVLHAMFVDIDNFKRVNDLYGLAAGDELLVAVSRHIQRGAAAFTSRIGGDEFVVLFDGSVSRDMIEKRARKLIEGMTGLDFREDIRSLTSLSIGIVYDQKAGQSLDEILARCDAAMYQSKYSGKDQYTVYDAEDRSFEIRRRIELEMEDALHNGEFQVFFQPRVNIADGGVVGAEALSRWVHPREGMHLPAAFIPVFEKNGFISKLDLFIYEEVCRMKAAWRNRSFGGIPVSVNMSRVHLFEPQFTEKLCSVADRYDIPHGELEIEISEHLFTRDAPELVRMTRELQDRGFRVTIDNFGSDFQALTLLKDLTADMVKLDKEFLHVTSDSVRGRTIISGLITLCRDLQIEVVTEGIENKDQADFILQAGCGSAQGFFYAKPLEIPKFEEFAQEHPEG
ncbi:MAG: GGDEF and EAL domain-containing protein [Lachnospiraceae bacterium]|nr:GGDEF and EAL domain-containing protein [Lachnospiraceae bacterium]